MKLPRFKNITSSTNQFLNWLIRNLQTIINVTLLVIGLYGIRIANKTLENAKLEHKQSMVSSDSLYNMQKQELDSLLEFTNIQIELSEKQLKEYIYQTRPKIALKSVFESGSSYSQKSDYFTVKIELELTNVGGRTAKDIEAKSTLMSSDLKSKTKKFNNHFTDKLNPEETIVGEIDLEGEYLFKSNYFLYITISYYDEGQGKNLFQEYNLKYDGGEYGIRRCNYLEIKKIKSVQ